MYRVPNTASFPLDPLRLAAERGRLVRFCTRQVGSAEAAEDLAQETLIIAWQRHHTLRDGDLWQAWLNGIARNVCLRYLRRVGQDQARLVSADGPQATLTFETLPDTSLPDLNELLEQDDISHLIDRALKNLPGNTQSLLVERYIQDMPIQEIAARRGIREETATVQLHRSRQALRKVLTESGLREDSAALGLIDDSNPAWQETRLWCPDCGMHRLEGLMFYWVGDGTKSQCCPITCTTCGNGRPCGCDKVLGRHLSMTFALRCPRCMMHTASCSGPPAPLVRMNNASMLIGIKGFKPALNRVTRWWHEHTQRIIQGNPGPCMKCGHTHINVHTTAGGDFPWADFIGKTGLFTHCPRCGSASAIEAHEIARQTPEGQHFWQKTPRFRTLAAVPVDSNDGKLLVTRLESVTGSSALEIALHARTMEVARVHRVGA